MLIAIWEHEDANKLAKSLARFTQFAIRRWEVCVASVVQNRHAKPVRWTQVPQGCPLGIVRSSRWRIQINLEISQVFYQCVQPGGTLGLGNLKLFFSPLNHYRAKRTLDNIREGRTSMITLWELSKTQTFEELLRRHVFLRLLQPREELTGALQSPRFTATGAKVPASVLREALDKMGSQDIDVMWMKTKARYEERELQMLHSKTERNVPKGFEHT